MSKKIFTIIAATVLLAPSLSAQKPEKPTPKPTAAEQQQPAPPRESAPRPEPQGQAVNVRLELTIIDQTGPGDPTRKVITMIVADRQNGFIRSRATVRAQTTPGFSFRDVTINVDARPTLLKPSAESNIRVDLGLEYQPTSTGGKSAPPPEDPGMSNLNERISVILEPGKPLTISQAADPASDRRISVELKATVLK